MNFGELLWWYLGNVRDYATQMLPCMCAATAVYALALPARRRRLDRLGLGASTAIESIQYFIGRSADVDDVLLNTAGALLGFWLFWLARALCPRLIAGFQCHECHERGDDNGLSHGN